MTESVPPITAVILSFNATDTLPDVIEGVVGQTVPLRKVIAVDNGSTDGTAGYLRTIAATVDTVLLDANRGVGGGHNEGWRRALADSETEFVWALEHDTIPEASCLERLVATFRFFTERGLRVGAVWPVQVLPEFLEGWHPGANLLEPSEDAWTNGAPHLTTKLHLNGPLFAVEALRDVGLLREDFIVGQEDRELGLRLSQAGYAVVRDPFAVVGHRNKGKLRRGGRHDVRRTYYGTRNGVYLMRHAGSERFLLPKVMAHALGGAARSILREDHKRERVRARLLGARDGWRGALGLCTYRFVEEAAEP